jgi:hypothetical protein
MAKVMVPEAYNNLLFPGLMVYGGERFSEAAPELPWRARG